MPTCSAVANEILVMGRISPHRCFNTRVSNHFGGARKLPCCKLPALLSYKFLQGNRAPLWSPVFCTIVACCEDLSLVLCVDRYGLFGVWILITEKHFWIYLNWKWCFMSCYTWRSVGYKSYIKEMPRIFCVWSLNCYLHRFLWNTWHLRWSYFLDSLNIKSAVFGFIDI